MSAPSSQPVAPDIYTEDYFLTCAAGYDRWEQSRGMHLHPVLAGVLETARLSVGMRVLDVGSGRGEIVLNAASYGATAVGIDYAEGALSLAARARSQHADLQDRAGFTKADAKMLPFPDSVFDWAFMLDVVEHLHEWELDRALAEVRRVLRPTGSVFIHTMPNLWFYSYAYPPLRWAARLLQGKRLPRDPRVEEERSMHVNEQSPRSLARSLERAGFVADLSYSGYVRSPLDRGLVDRVVRAAGRHRPLRRYASFNIFAIATPR